jgi:hypothetical protein
MYTRAACKQLLSLAETYVETAYSKGRSALGVSDVMARIVRRRLPLLEHRLVALELHGPEPAERDNKRVPSLYVRLL